jgi:hypothetical protein
MGWLNAFYDVFTEIHVPFALQYPEEWGTDIIQNGGNF